MEGCIDELDSDEEWLTVRIEKMVGHYAQTVVAVFAQEIAEVGDSMSEVHPRVTAQYPRRLPLIFVGPSHQELKGRPKTPSPR